MNALIRLCIGTVWPAKLFTRTFNIQARLCNGASWIEPYLVDYIEDIFSCPQIFITDKSIFNKYPKLSLIVCNDTIHCFGARGFIYAILLCTGSSSAHPSCENKSINDCPYFLFAIYGLVIYLVSDLYELELVVHVYGRICLKLFALTVYIKYASSHLAWHLRGQKSSWFK